MAKHTLDIFVITNNCYELYLKEEKTMHRRAYKFVIALLVIGLVLVSCSEMCRAEDDGLGPYPNPRLSYYGPPYSPPPSYYPPPPSVNPVPNPHIPTDWKTKPITWESLSEIMTRWSIGYGGMLHCNLHGHIFDGSEPCWKCYKELAK